MQFGLMNVFVRWLATLALMFSFYNPSGRSFVHWAADGMAAGSVRIFVGCVLITGFLILGGATIRSLGYPGVVVLVTILAILGGTLLDLGVVDSAKRVEVIVALQVLIASGLTIGLSWSALRARLSGQVDSDDVSKRL
jgi:Family of unknown function (DUF6524)